MITETDAVQAALDELRAIVGPNIDMAEVVVVGAREQARRLSRGERSDAETMRLRERFLERSLSGDGVDLGALIDVHERGWTRAG